MEELIIKLKNDNYDNETIKTIVTVVNGFINVLGEEYKDLVLNAVSKVHFFKYDSVDEASATMTNVINDGNNHNAGALADGGGFMEPYYRYSDDRIDEYYLVGVASKNLNFYHTLVHEIAHVISTNNKNKIEDDKYITHCGLNTITRKIENGKVGNVIQNDGVMFNEILTESLAVQVMDFLEPGIVHEPVSYNGYVMFFKGIFRNKQLNPLFINNYLNSSLEFLDYIEEVVSKETLDSSIQDIIDSLGLDNEEIAKYFEYLKSLSVKDFFILFINGCNSITKRQEGISRETSRLMKKINVNIINNISTRLMEDEYSNEIRAM